MNKKEKQFIINYLQKNLDESVQMWDDKKPHAQIVGYLQGTLKSLIHSLKE
jgi:hypothetical protein